MKEPQRVISPLGHLKAILLKKDGHGPRDLLRIQRHENSQGLREYSDIVKKIESSIKIAVNQKRDEIFPITISARSKDSFMKLATKLQNEFGRRYEIRIETADISLPMRGNLTVKIKY